MAWQKSLNIVTRSGIFFHSDGYLCGGELNYINFYC